MIHPHMPLFRPASDDTRSYSFRSPRGSAAADTVALMIFRLSWDSLLNLGDSFFDPSSATTITDGIFTLELPGTDFVGQPGTSVSLQKVTYCIGHVLPDSSFATHYNPV